SHPRLPRSLSTLFPYTTLFRSANLLPYPSGSIRENVEVFLVTGAVVLALRTFFFQPMAIPSGSAQPTLWGITSENFRGKPDGIRSEEHTSELQSRVDLVCRLLL